MCFCVVTLLFLVSQDGVAVFASAYGIGVYYVADKDAPVANLARMRHAQNNLDGRLYKLVAAHDSDGHALYNIGRVLYATIDAFLAALPDTMHVMVFEPVDV